MLVHLAPGHTAELFLYAVAELASDGSGGHILDSAVPKRPLTHRFDLMDEAGSHHGSIAFAAMLFLSKYARFIAAQRGRPYRCFTEDVITAHQNIAKTGFFPGIEAA